MCVIDLPRLDSLVTLPVKALTISQPFASMIAVTKEKFVENRTWPTAYRGPLAIHAGKGLQYMDRHELKQYPHGGIIGVADLVACLKIWWISTRSVDPLSVIQGTNLTWFEVDNHKHTEGPWCWILQNVRECEFIPCLGKQGLWEYT